MGRVSAPGIGRQTNKNTNRLAARPRARLHAVNVKFEKLAFEFQAQLATSVAIMYIYPPSAWKRKNYMNKVCFLPLYQFTAPASFLTS